MDILDKLIPLAQISGSLNIQCHFQGEWAIAHQAKLGQGIIHIVTHGKGYLKLEGEAEGREIKQGDIIFFPRSPSHTLSHHNRCVNFESNPTAYRQGAFEMKRIGEGEADFCLFCAELYYQPHADLIQSLPDVIFLHLDQPQLQPIMAMLQLECEGRQVGSSVVVNGLSMILLTFMLRIYLADPRQQLSGVLKGWQNPRLRPLLNAILQNPEFPWKIEDMQQTAYLSRSQLIRLFKQALGISPHAFVHQIRLQKSAMLLKQRADSILSIALACGFQSETHFGKAFKKYYGVTPSLYRKSE